MESTDTGARAVAEAGAAGSAGTVRPARYLVPDWARVRHESFGLLFYDTRSTGLTFVRSGESLVAPPSNGSRRVVTVGNVGPGRHDALERLLENLTAKGLLLVDRAD